MLIRYNGQRYPRIVGAGHNKVFFHQAPKNIVCVSDELAYMVLKENLKIGNIWEFEVLDKMPDELIPKRVERPDSEAIEAARKKPNKPIRIVKTAEHLPKVVPSMNAMTKNDIKRYGKRRRVK